MIISNSSPLILLARINRLGLLEGLYKKVYIPYEVYNEVVIKGKRENYSDAALVEKLINGFILVKSLSQQHKKEAEKLMGIMGSGESEAIALCMQENAELLLMDNLEPRRLAQSKGIRCRSTPGIMLDCLKKGIFAHAEYESAIKELSRHAWLSGDIVAYFLEEGYKEKTRETKNRRGGQK
ncbi:hypothetical protein HYU15_03610 [Candidatus Woesearchaeota archaeon]|nr:hypothetical protein [Candidatus Woesearchaeota archaeon]